MHFAKEIDEKTSYKICIRFFNPYSSNNMCLIRDKLFINRVYVTQEFQEDDYKLITLDSDEIY